MDQANNRQVCDRSNFTWSLTHFKRRLSVLSLEILKFKIEPEKKTKNTTLLEQAIQDEQEQKPFYDESIQK